MAVKQFGPTAPEPYPAEMRTQLWPLCCGAAILSGFKNVGGLTPEALVNQITETVESYVPDHQVFVQEQIKPKLVFLTLNSDQMGSKKIMAAVSEAGFVKFAEAAPRGAPQGFFVRDKSKSFKPVAA
jgi:hypothetical protein